MNRKAIAVSFGTIALIALTGCQALDNMERENYQRTCDNLGIERGSSTYGECMLQQQRMDNDNFQRSMDRQNVERIINR